MNRFDFFQPAAAAWVALGLGTSVWAQEAKPLWEYGVSGFGIRAPAYIGSEQSKTAATALPWFIYRGKVFRADGETVGARLIKQERLEFDVGVGAALGASSDDVVARVGMPSLGFQFEFGPRAKWLLAQPSPGTTVRLDLPYRAVMEVKDGLQFRGMVLEPELKYTHIVDGVRWQVGAGAVWGDQRYAQFVYGVPAAFATASRPAFTGRAGLITKRLDSSVRVPINPDFSVFAFARYDSASGAANVGSPLFKKSGGASIGGGLVWTIGRSASSAPD